MNKETTAIETKNQTIASDQGEPKIVTPTEDDPEAKIAALEAEKARLIEGEANYKLAYLKEKKKNKKGGEDEDLEEDEDDRIRRISKETLADSRIAEIAREQDLIIKRTLKENKELRTAQLNKPNGVPSALGTHTESQVVRDTLVTPEQIEAFKKRGWTDKDIERYKKNLQKNH